MAESKEIKVKMKQKLAEEKKKVEPKKEEPKKVEPVKEEQKEVKKDEVKKEEAKPEKKDEAKKEEAKPEKKEDKKELKAPVIKEERIITIPLRKAFESPRYKRARRAATVLKDQLKRHMKTEVKIDESLNAVIWARGARKPPRSIKVKVQVTDVGAKAYPVK
jgi:ribosomal protein L31E